MRPSSGALLTVTVATGVYRAVIYKVMYKQVLYVMQLVD